MAEYLVDEFIGGGIECTLDEQIDKKISLLYDMCMLVKRKKEHDDREKAVRQLLSSYTTETQVNNVIRDVVVGNITINQLLKRKGYLQ